MSNWLPPIPCSIKTNLIALANKLAFIIDPDTGGGKTFSLDYQQGGYVTANIPFLADFLPIVQAKEPDTWFDAMAQLAESRNREPLTRDEIETLCREMLICDEVNQIGAGA